VAGMTVDSVRNKLYMVDGSRYILEFNVTYDATTHVPTLDLVGKHFTNYQNISSMSLDFAGNLYVTGGGYGTSSLNRMQVAVFSPATSNNTTLVPAREPIIFPAEPTSITNFDDENQVVRFVRDGHIFIQNQGVIYNILGQIVK
jgi:hypothetical protein